jgi:hypothetical protein
LIDEKAPDETPAEKKDSKKKKKNKGKEKEPAIERSEFLE